MGTLLDTLNLPWDNLDVGGNSARFMFYATAMTVVRDGNLRNKSRLFSQAQATLAYLVRVAKSWTSSTVDVPSLDRLFEGHLEEAPLTRRQKRRISGKERRDRKSQVENPG